MVLAFLAGAGLDPKTLGRSWKEAFGIGLAGFFAPFLGAAWPAHALLGWDARASWLAGVALSTTSVAVVHAVMLELGLNRTPFGKVILAACFWTRPRTSSSGFWASSPCRNSWPFSPRIPGGRRRPGPWPNGVASWGFGNWRKIG